jgi:hypothetical protein
MDNFTSDDDYASAELTKDAGAAESSEASEDYAALDDPRLVMAEVMRLLGELHRSVTRLGDAIVAAGLPAREWRTDDAFLGHLPGELPEITLDTLLTRLAEFAADLGPHLLHGGTEELAHFHDETLVLYEVIRPLRSFAQRQRMLPARERGEQPLWRALGDARLGTPLDLAAGHLRDLDALAPFLAPLAPADWQAIEQRPAATTVKKAKPGKSGQEAGAARRPAGAPLRAVHLEAAEAAVEDAATGVPPAPAPASAPAIGPAEAAPPEAANAAEAAEIEPPPLRLRDFVPTAPPAAAARGAESRWTRARQASERFLARRWIVVAAAAVLLGVGTGLLTLAARGEQGPLPPPKIAYLETMPASLHLACSGRGSSVTFYLHNTGTSVEVWMAAVPRGVTLSSLKGTLTPGSRGPLRLSAAPGAKATHNTLTFTDADGMLAVPYTITCGR